MAHEAQWWCYFSACNSASPDHIMVLNVEECGRMWENGSRPGGKVARHARKVCRPGRNRTGMHKNPPELWGRGAPPAPLRGKFEFHFSWEVVSHFCANPREPTRMHKKVQECMGNIKGWSRTQNISNSMPEECVTRSLTIIYRAHSYYFTPMTNGGIKKSLLILSKASLRSKEIIINSIKSCT